MPDPCFRLALLVLSAIVALEGAQGKLWTFFGFLLDNDPAKRYRPATFE